LKKSEFNRIGLIANTGKISSRLVVKKAAALVTAAGRKVFSDTATAKSAALKVDAVPDAEALAAASDLLLVFGGDGTMLRVVREVRGSQTPILGINAGRLGFLTAVPSKELAPALHKIWAGDFSIESRCLVEASGSAGGKPTTLTALNDIVITRGAASRMIELDVIVNNEPLTRYRCDGLIVSSPTGSTAYSLSAGGAIIAPSSDVLAITPICPHTLSNRSVIVSLDSVIQVRVLSETVDTNVSADGQVQTELAFGDVITIRRSALKARLVHLGGSSFFETVRRKLNWSGSNVESECQK
jgi:NAD+ kinase